MNIFQIIFLDTILISFPILIYLIYLSTDKNINNKTKRIYLRLALITSFFMIYDYGIGNSKLISIMIISSIIVLSYLEDLYFLANVFLLVIIFIYKSSFNNIIFLLYGYIITVVLYLLKCSKKINNLIFVELCVLVNGLVYYIWIYKYNYEFFNNGLLITIIICYLFIINIICSMYKAAKKVLETHISYKELQQEKQIRLSLFKITHEIKNPIAVCKGYLDMLNVNNQDQVKKYIPIIKSEIERLISLLQDFLLINKNNIDLDIMDFNMLIEDVLNKLDSMLKEKNIKLKLNLIDDEIFINGDYNRLSQVLINIIKNSVEAMDNKNNGKITISTKVKDLYYIVIVEDNGIGINKEILNKIKEPFFTTKKRGSGLGVPLIYEIIEAHGGKVEYSSEYGNGTKVVIQIPLYL